MSKEKYSPRERVLRLFRKEKVDRVPVFSGMGNITIHGLKENDVRFSEVHGNPKLLAATAVSSYKLFGFECAVVPYDITVEAEVLGCTVNMYPHKEEIIYPTIKEKAINTIEDLKIPDDLSSSGRVPVVVEAIKLLKTEVSNELAVGTYILGPFLLAGQIMELEGLLKKAYKDAEEINRILNVLTDFIIQLARVYKDAGVDYITIREMGASADVLSPRMFRSLIKPHLDKIMHEIDSPKVLHICGNTNPIVVDMADTGADAISVEAKNDVEKTRKLLGKDTLVFGNLDTYQVLCLGTPEDVEKEVLRCIQAGVSAVWPGCDIWPDIPAENMRILVNTVKRYGMVEH
jgi:[methyl-Co(III) methanol-specific corrinoid protein]:coenzyme M methyltransferase